MIKHKVLSKTANKACASCNYWRVKTQYHRNDYITLNKIQEINIIKIIQ